MRYIYIFLLASNLVLNAQNTITNCIDKVYGQVVDKSTDTGIFNATITIQNQSDEISTIQSDKDGKFYLEFPCEDTCYTLSTSVENFTSSTKLVFLNKNIAKKFNFQLNLYPIKEFVMNKGKKMIVSESISFPPNEMIIDSESALILNKVFNILTKYPYLKIEIGFHTDSRGVDKLLLDLSSKRAQVCAQYLEKKGIDSSRLTPKGYGATQLLNHCKKDVKCSEKEHLINRRSEFIVIPQ